MSVVLKQRARARIDLEQPLVEQRGRLVGDRHDLRPGVLNQFFLPRQASTDSLCVGLVAGTGAKVQEFQTYSAGAEGQSIGRCASRLKSSGCTRRLRDGCAARASTALNISRMRASDTGLSTTTTSSGLLDEARTRPQVPSSTVTRTPLTVTRSRIGWPATLSPFCLRRLEVLHHLLDDAVFLLVVAMRRHGRRAPGLRQRVLQLRHRLSGIAVEHVADRERRNQAVVVAAAERLVEEVVAGLLEAGERAEFVGRGASCRNGRSSSSRP